MNANEGQKKGKTRANAGESSVVRSGSGHEGYRETPEEIYKLYLRELHLTEADLLNKRILDVGAGSAGFAAAVQKLGLPVEVMSVDADDTRDEDPRHTREGFVQAEAQRLPFADDTFDMVVSVSSMPHVAGNVEKPKGMRTSEQVEEYKRKNSESIATAVRECLRVVKEGGEVRFGGVPTEKPKNKLDAEGFPNLPWFISNPGAMEGFDLGRADARLLTYPETEDERLFVLRKLTEAEKPWPKVTIAAGENVRLEDIDIHPEFRDAAKGIASLLAGIHEKETGESVPANEMLARFMGSEGFVTTNGDAQFPLGDEDGYMNIPEGFWRILKASS